MASNNCLSATSKCNKYNYITIHTSRPRLGLRLTRLVYGANSLRELNNFGLRPQMSAPTYPPT